MAETSQHPQTLDDLSEPQREALTWLHDQSGAGPVDPPAEHRSQTWKALAHRDLVSVDGDGNVTMLDAGSALFGPAAAQSSDGGDFPAPAGIQVETGTGSPSADEAAAAAQPGTTAGTGQPEMAGTVGEPTGEDPAPAPASSVDQGPIHEQHAATYADLRAGMRGVSPDFGAYRVLGEPEPLYGGRAGEVRVPVMRVDTGARAYLRGKPDTKVTQDG